MKKTENQKTRKKSNEKRKNPDCRHVNGPAQYRAHAGGTGLGPANGRSIGFAGRKEKIAWEITRSDSICPLTNLRKHTTHATRLCSVRSGI
jgi:hypothetical protein